jgi:hypothetical protein
MQSESKICRLLHYQNGIVVVFGWFQSHHKTDIRTSILYVNGKPNIVIMDYMINMTSSNDKKLSHTFEKNDEESVR